VNIPQNVVLVGAAVLAILAMAAALGAAWFAGRRQAEAGLAVPGGSATGVRAGYGEPREPGTTGMASTGAAGAGGAGGATDGLFATDEATIDRVTRVVSLLFIAAVGAVTAISPGETWDTVATYLLLAVGTLFVAFVGDLLKERMPAAHRYALQAVGAIAFLGLLTGFTGGLESPFVIGYFLLVGGAALAWDGSGPVALALGSGLSYAFIGLVVVLNGGLGRPGGPEAVSATNLTWILFVLTALLLLAYVGTVAGRAQRRARDAALRLSRYDALTGLYNRGAFFAAVEREIKRVERSGRGFCLVMMDLDDLKPVNDTFGHPAGDQLLRAITEVVLRTVRATDLAGRYGGDEFVVLLPETDADGAFVVAEKLRRDISGLAIRVQERAVRTSVSLGLVTYPDDGRTIDDLLSAVDAAMYEAKRRGKNQIVGYTTRTERVATAIGPERVPSPPARSRPRPEDSRAEEVGLARPAGRETVDSTWAPPSGREEAVGGPGVPDPSTVPAAAPASSPVELHDDDPLDAAAPAYPVAGGGAAARSGPGSVEVAVPESATGSAAGSAAPAVAGSVAPDPVPSADPVTAGQAAAAATVRAPFPKLPSMPSLPAQPVRSEPIAAPVPAVARAATPIQPRDAAAAGLPPVPIGDQPWTPRPSSRGSNAPRGARAPADRQYVAFPIEDDQPR
jgi:diguanylate cyclase (GGDEF)-like protein